MNYIVNNTGIPTSDWGKYKPAGINKDGPSLDLFSALEKTEEGASADVIAKLTDGSKATLRRLKTAPNSISKTEWMDLMSELNHMGVISDSDYTWSRVDLHLVPLGNDMDRPFQTTEDMRSALTQLSQWSGNPFEHLEQWAFSLRKWGTALSLERNPDGTPVYKDLSPIYDQAGACDRVSDLLKKLAASV